MKPLESLKEKLYNFWRKQFGSFIVLDERETARENPYTYYLPSEEKLAAIEPGDSVKIVIRSVPHSHLYDAERVWVTVEEISCDDFTGSLQNTPLDIPQLRPNDKITFKRWAIIDCLWENPRKEDRYQPEKTNQYWGRCLVDAEVINGDARVGFLYRETPDAARDEDNYPDTGWRIRADIRHLTEEQYDNPTAVYIAIGKVLNKDDSWLHLIDAKVGSRFFRNPDTDEFEPTD